MDRQMLRMSSWNCGTERNQCLKTQLTNNKDADSHISVEWGFLITAWSAAELRQALPCKNVATTNSENQNSQSFQKLAICVLEASALLQYFTKLRLHSLSKDINVCAGCSSKAEQGIANYKSSCWSEKQGLAQVLIATPESCSSEMYAMNWREQMTQLTQKQCLVFQCYIYLAKVPSKAADMIFIACKNDAKIF